VTGNGQHVGFEGGALAAVVCADAEAYGAEQVIHAEEQARTGAVVQFAEASDTDVHGAGGVGHDRAYFSWRDCAWLDGRKGNFASRTGNTRGAFGACGTHFTLRATGAFGALGAGWTLLTLGTLRSWRARRALEFAGGDLGAELLELVAQHADLRAELLERSAVVLLEAGLALIERVDIGTELVHDITEGSDVFVGEELRGIHVVLNDEQETLHDERCLIARESFVSAESTVGETVDNSQVSDPLDCICSPVIRLYIREGLGLCGHSSQNRGNDQYQYASH
jgi:hypothetical protein